MSQDRTAENLINKMFAGFLCSVFAGVIAWVTFVGFVVHTTSACNEQNGG